MVSLSVVKKSPDYNNIQSNIIIIIIVIIVVVVVIIIIIMQKTAVYKIVDGDI